MKELTAMETETVSGGIVKVLIEGLMASGTYDIFKWDFSYAMQNSHMGKGNFPPVPRAGRE